MNRRSGASLADDSWGDIIGLFSPPSGLLVPNLPAALKHYQIQSPADRQAQVSAVRASLNCLSVAPDRISFPLLAPVYRAVLGKADFSLYLTGKTGVFKTALAVLCQQNFVWDRQKTALTRRSGLLLLRRLYQGGVYAEAHFPF